jgi:hypothetical protein
MAHMDLNAKGQRLFEQFVSGELSEKDLIREFEKELAGRTAVSSDGADK